MSAGRDTFLWRPSSLGRSTSFVPLLALAPPVQVLIALAKFPEGDRLALLPAALVAAHAAPPAQAQAVLAVKL